MNKKTSHIIILLLILSAVLFLVLSQHSFFRLDLTSDKRYSISETSKTILSKVNEDVYITLYLAGDLDVNMAQLRYAINNKVSDLNLYAGNKLHLREFDPNDVDKEEERIANYKRLDDMGMKGLSVSNKNAQGGISRSVVFPWMVVICAGDTMPVCLIDPEDNIHPDQVVQAVIEDIEYMLMDAIRIVTSERVMKIAFIEGHGELSEMQTYDITEALSRYFQVDRGVVGGQLGVLDSYDAIIIADPTQAFTEADKFVIDQYVMNGGSVFWCVDGVRMSDTMLTESGLSPVIPIDLNLEDMLFKYGVRVTNTVVQDMQCAYTPVNIAMPNEAPKFENVPWFYSPLLSTSPYHSISKNKGEVMADFASALDFTGDTVDVKKEIVLISSNASRVVAAPAEVDIRKILNVEPKDYFYHSYVPVATVMEGEFTSVFENRMSPIVLPFGEKIRTKSKKARMIVVADGSIMENSLESQDGGLWVVPLGTDRATRRVYGNKDFVVNALLYLTDNDGLMELRNRTIPVRLLNSALVSERSTYYKVVNVMLPLLVLLVIAVVVVFVRKRKYNR